MVVSRGTIVITMSRPEWPKAIESLNEYSRNSFNLPADNSLISPIARVILQKRRLLKIQEIHNLLLGVSSEPSESLTQVSTNLNCLFINFLV